MNSSNRNHRPASLGKFVHREPKAHVAYLFRKLSRLLRASRSVPEPKTVHQLRTTIRRVETLAGSLGVSNGKPYVKYGKLLTEIFDKAGKVRDLDVQLEALATISLPSIEDDKTVLHNHLQRQRSKRQRKLAQTVDGELVKRLPKRQRRAKAALLEAATQNSSPRSRYDLRKEMMPFLAKLRANHFDMQTLHELRLDLKKIRYAAEAAGRRGDEIVAVLKPVQDAIGTWHDWLNLINTADKVLGPLPGHPLMTILRSKVRARFNEAIASLRPLEARLTEILPMAGTRRPGPVLVMKEEQATAAHAG